MHESKGHKQAVRKRVVSKYADKTVPISYAIIMVVLGVFFLIMPSMWKMLGAVFLLSGIILFALLAAIARQRRFYVKIKLVSGDIFTIGDKDEGVIDEIINVLRDAARDDCAKYIISTDARTIQCFVNSGVISNGDSNWITTYKDGKVKPSDKLDDINETDTPPKDNPSTASISDVEWKQLESYIARSMEGISKEDTFYNIMAQMRSCVSKKDKLATWKTVCMMDKKHLAVFFNYARSEEEKKAIVRIMKKIINK